MDKRSLLFFACVTGAFFCIQTWFGISEDKQRAAQLKIQQEQRAATDQTRLLETAERTASLDQLPVFQIFSDRQKKNCIGRAAKLGEHYFLIAKTTQFPEQAFLEKGSSVELLRLSSKSSYLGDPVVYSQAKTRCSAPFLPKDAQAELQFASLGEENPRIILAEQKKGEICIPFQFLGEKAIAFIRLEEGYQPIGIYEPEIKKIKAFWEYASIKHIVDQGKPIQLSSPSTQEMFYVLETPYQQLVFSTKGGSLSEINLPLKLDKASKSYVREIDIDRQILSQSPQNARFPLYPYRKAESPSLHTEGSLGGYYPLLRRSILHPDGTVKVQAPSETYALQVVSPSGELQDQEYKVTRFEQNLIQFQTQSSQRRITKTYSIPQERNGPYCFQLDVEIEGDARGLMLGSGIPDVELVGGSYSPLLRYQTSVNGGSDVQTIDLPKKTPISGNVEANWISNCNGFLGLIVDPTHQKADSYEAVSFDGNKIPTRLSLIDAAYRLYPAENYPGYTTYLPLKSGLSTFRVFAGPFDDGLLKELDDLYEDPTINYNPEYALAQSIQGWFSFISQPFAKFLFLLMQLFYAISGSWAFSIILLTLALRAMMYPLNAWSISSTLKMQEIAPKIKALQERYKSDPRRAQMEIMSLYKESKANPLTGCLPVFLQMPFLMGMFYLLKSSFPLRGAPFIPGWIDDLAAPDVLFSWGQPLWLIGNEFHLLPILMGLTMYLQQKITSKTPKDTSQLSESEKQQKMMGNMMSVLFTIMFYSFPSGLNIYFMSSTLLGVLQQWWMTKKTANLTGGASRK